MPRCSAPVGLGASRPRTACAFPCALSGIVVPGSGLITDGNGLEVHPVLAHPADRDPDHVPEQFRVSERVRPETKAQGRRMEKAYAKDLSDTKRRLAEAGAGPLKQELKIPSHLYHGKIRQTGDKNYWLDAKNRKKHGSCRVDNYGRAGRGKG